MRHALRLIPRRVVKFVDVFATPRGRPVRFPVRALLIAASGAVCICCAPGLLVAQHVTGRAALPPAAPMPTESRISVAPGLVSRSPALQDPRFAIKAMRLTSAQEAGLAAVRARYVNAIKGYVARLNAIEQAVAQGSASKDNLVATEDTLKAILTAEHRAADSLITPEQKQRYQNAIRQVHAASVINAGGSTASKSSERSATRSASAASVVPIP